jgi:hypothetical protein
MCVCVCSYDVNDDDFAIEILELNFEEKKFES